MRKFILMVALVAELMFAQTYEDDSEDEDPPYSLLQLLIEAARALMAGEGSLPIFIRNVPIPPDEAAEMEEEGERGERFTHLVQLNPRSY